MQRDRRGDRDIQAVDARGHGNPRQTVGGVAGPLRQTRELAPDEDRHPFGHGDLVDRAGVAVDRQADQVQSPFLSQANEVGRPVARSDGRNRQGMPERDAQALAIEMVMAARAEDDRVDPERRRVAVERSDVVDVGDVLADEDRPQRTVARESVELKRGGVRAMSDRQHTTMDGEARDRLHRALGSRVERDAPVAGAVHRLAHGRRVPMLDEDRSRHARTLEHAVDDEARFADEEPSASGRPEQVAIAHACVVGDARIIERVNRDDRSARRRREVIRFVAIARFAHAFIIAELRCRYTPLRMAETKFPGRDGPGDERDPLASGKEPLAAGDHVGHHDPDAPTDSAIEHPTDETPEDRRVGELLQGSIDAEELAEAVEQQEAPDAADTLEHIQLEEGGEQAAEVLAEMDVESAAEALAHMITALGVSVLEDLIDEDPAYAGKLIEEMAPDDATDLLQALPDGDRDRLLGMLGKVEAVKLRRLLDFDERSAGGMMTTDYLAVRDSMTVAEAIEAIRRAETETEWIYVFVVDWRATLKGRVTMRRLLLGRPEQKIIELCDSPVDAVHPDMPREEVAREFEKYDYLVLPVVDEQHRLLGVITVDDIIDSIREESTEDAQMMVGAGKEEAVFSTTAEKFKSRLPWLIVNLFTSSLAAIVVIQFAEILDAIWILAAIMPVIANQAGNAGQQSLAVTLRGIVLDQVRPQTVRSLIFREGLVGFLNGTCNGILVGGIVALLEWFLVPGTNAWGLGAVVAIAMTVALTVGCVVGTSVPLLLRRFGADPATASTIFLTMVTDSFSFFTFLGLAMLLQNWFLSPVTA